MYAGPLLISTVNRKVPHAGLMLPFLLTNSPLLCTHEVIFTAASHVRMAVEAATCLACGYDEQGSARSRHHHDLSHADPTPHRL